MTLVIMAAGLGSRYGGMKQADPFGHNGEFLIDYSIYDAVLAGFDRVVLIIREEHLQIFRDTLEKRIAHEIKVDYAFQRMTDIPPRFANVNRVKPWGTCHAVLSCEDKVDGVFAVINADDFYGREAFFEIADFLRNSKSDDIPEFCMPGYVLRNTLTANGHVARGVCEASADGFLCSVEERKRILSLPDGGTAWLDQDDVKHSMNPESIVSMNFWGFDERVFPMFRRRFEKYLDASEHIETDEYCISSAVDSCISGKDCRVKIIPTAAKWFGVTYAADKAAVQEKLSSLVATGVYPEKLF